MRHTWRFFDYEARCQDCAWETCGKNGLGNAAQHHDRTGHTVSTDVSGNVMYCDDAENERLLAKKEK